MKVLHVAETVHGGIATYLDEVLPFQVEKYGCENVALLIPGGQYGSLESKVKFVNFSFFRNGRNVSSFVSLAKEYIRCLKLFSPEVVHVHSSFAGFILRLVNFFLFFKSRFIVVYCPHGWSFSMAGEGLKKYLYALLEKVLSVRTDAIVCISEYERKIAIDFGINSRLMNVIHNGINCVAPNVDLGPVVVDVDAGKINILFVGRFHKAKGFDALPSVFGKLGDRYKLYVAGGAVLENEIDIAVPDNVIKIGWINKNQLQYYYNMVDFVIIPSRWEGFGFVAVESLRAGKPVVCSKNGALPEIIIDGLNGALFDDVENPQEIEKCIRDFAETDFKKMGKKGRDIFLDNFTAEIMNNKLISLYEKTREKKYG